MAKRKSGSTKYSLADLANMHREGKVSDRQYRRAGGICGPNELDDPAYQRDAGPGFGRTQDYGPGDGFGGRDHLDSFKGNRRQFPKESRVSAYKTDWYRTSPRAAPMQPSYDVYDTPSRN
jgi:hypothetical protein